MVLLTAEFFCGVNNDIASSRGCRHGRHGFPSRLPRVATSTVCPHRAQKSSAGLKPPLATPWKERHRRQPAPGHVPRINLGLGKPPQVLARPFRKYFWTKRR